jgi:hypothetical protein
LLWGVYAGFTECGVRAAIAGKLDIVGPMVQNSKEVLCLLSTAAAFARG